MMHIITGSDYDRAQKGMICTLYINVCYPNFIFINIPLPQCYSGHGLKPLIFI